MATHPGQLGRLCYAIVDRFLLCQLCGKIDVMQPFFDDIIETFFGEEFCMQTTVIVKSMR